MKLRRVAASAAKHSKLQEIGEPAQDLAEPLAVLGLELAQQRFFELGPMIGEAIADADAALGKGDAGNEFGADGATIDQIPLDEAGEAGRQHVGGEAEFGGQVLFGGAGAAEFKEDGIVARFEPALLERHKQSLMRQLPSRNELIERGTG